MADDPTKISQDRKLINVNEDYEIKYWTKALGVDETALRAAVAEVGTSAAAVRSHLGLASEQK